MNVLVITTADAPINSIRPELDVFVGLAERGHQLTIFTHGDSEYGKIFRERGIHVIDQQPKRKICREMIAAIREELRRQHYDIIYATNSKAIPNAAFAAIGFSVKMVSYRGTTGGLYRHDPTAYLTHLHPRVDGVICVSNAVRDDVRQRVWRRRVRENVVTIYKGHNIDWYNKPPADLSEFGIKPSDFVLICAVNARPSKGIPVMLAATHQLADLADVHLILAGRNMEQYQELASQSPMAKRIHIVGFRTDAPELIVASDLLIQPSISGEGLPRAVMEAMGYGTPPVITTAGGGKEVVEHEVSGMIVPVNDAKAIADAVRKLHAEPERVEKMQDACRALIRGRFSLANTVEQTEAYFQQLIGAG